MPVIVNGATATPLTRTGNGNGNGGSAGGGVTVGRESMSTSCGTANRRIMRNSNKATSASSSSRQHQQQHQQRASPSAMSTTAVIIQILSFLCILYIILSAYAFYGFHYASSSSSSSSSSSLSIQTESSLTTSTASTSTAKKKKTTKSRETNAKAKEDKDKDPSPSQSSLSGVVKTKAKALSSTVSSTVSSSSFSLQANRQAAERLLQLGAQYASDSEAAHNLLRNTNILTAYIEGPLHDTVPGTGSRGDHVKDANKKHSDEGTPPDFVIPLPLRTQSPQDLIVQQYPKLQKCNDLPAKFPVDRGLELEMVNNNNNNNNITDPDTNATITMLLQPVVWNVGEGPVADTFVQDELPFCPVESDPFLPWIHDVFPSRDGKYIYFMAQNKRRCRTGVLFDDAVNRLVPQVALMQGISVIRLPPQNNGNDGDQDEAKRLAPQLWSPPTTTDDTDTDTTTTTPRYRLVPIEEAMPNDGQLTRFICRFHTTDYSSSNTDNTSSSSSGNTKKKTIILGETLSQYPFNYELAAYRKGGMHAGAGLITPRGKDGKFFWASHLQFTCPVPTNIHHELQNTIATGTSLLSDSTPTLFVDVIPIRTSVRYSTIHMTENMIGPKRTWRRPAFNATLHWGNANVLPRVEASGRWENIPLCAPPKAPPPVILDNDDTTDKDTTTLAEQRDLTTKDNNEKASNDEDNNINNNNNKPPPKKKQHYLSACLWASAEFKTRGISRHGHATTDTMDRLQEWLEFHFLVGFDHVYVYDNSGAHSNTTNLQPVLSQYPASKVTWIDWPSIVCNNNIPAHDSTGERSSQYAAENSCRTRYAPYTTWIAAFDTDEYFVPMGNYTSLVQVLQQAQYSGTNILSFRSSRGRLRMDKSYHLDDGIGSYNDRRTQLPNATYLEAYNCDSAGSPKPEWADRARKQIYQTDYVLYHYVHYSTVTKGSMYTYQDHIDAGHSPETWSWNFAEKEPSERTVDEVMEAVLVHTKTIKPDQTGSWTQRCQYDYKKKWQGCWLAFPWPNVKNGTSISSGGSVSKTTAVDGHDEQGFEYNCFINERVDQYWVPRLHAALEKRKSIMAAL